MSDATSVRQFLGKMLLIAMMYVVFEAFEDIFDNYALSSFGWHKLCLGQILGAEYTWFFQERETIKQIRYTSCHSQGDKYTTECTGGKPGHWSRDCTVPPSEWINRQTLPGQNALQANRDNKDG